jgi:AAA15 family ATPase/GTPase
MRYKLFKIKNYKGIKETEIDLEGRINPGIFTLVGLNESGKTTILEAIKFLAEGEESSTLTAATLIPRRQRASFSDEVSIKATMELSKADLDDLIELIENEGYKDVAIEQEVSFKRSYKFDKSKYAGEYHETEINITASKKKSSKTPSTLSPLNSPDLFEKIDELLYDHLPPVVFYSDFLYSFPSKIYIDKNGATKSVQKFYSNVMGDVLASLNINLSLNELAEDIKSPKADDIGQVETVLGLMQHKITNTVFGKWNEIFGRKHAGKRILLTPGVEDDGEKSPAAFIKVTLEDGPDSFSIEERSLGFKWFFAFLLLTLFRKERKEVHEEILYLLDEPASNLHPSAQKKILETIKDLGEKNSKLIYTTHSHFLINPEWLEGAYIVKNQALDSEDPLYGDTQETDIAAIKYRKFAAEHPDQKEYFEPILQTLDYQPSHIEMIEPLVVTEGKFDFFTYSYLKKHFFPKYKKINFYPGGGAGSSSDVISLYIAWSKSFVVLLDSDKAGKVALKKYNERFGVKFMSNKLVIYSDVVASWDKKETEHLFNDSDLLKIQQELYPTDTIFNKSYFNESIQKLLIDKKAIKLGKTTLANFEKVFIEINTKLKNQK